jgi:hypothetical protein
MRKPGTRYGVTHRVARKAALRGYQPGVTVCVRCGQPICEADLRKVHLDHDDSDPSGRRYLGLSHQKCNLAAQNQRRAALAKAALAGNVTQLPGSLPVQPAEARPGREPPGAGMAWREVDICTSAEWRIRCKYGPYPCRHPAGRCW